MLINATHTDEIRVAIADGQKLYDLDIDSAGHYRKKGNIYKAKITRIEPSLEACFVNYGSERHGFLPYKEISPAYCKQAPKGQPRLPINQALNEGDEIIVQVNKEERGNKGAALSTYISLAGRYLVYMPGNHRAGGISRQIKGDKRAHLQDVLRRLEIPKNDGVIVRTAGIGCAFEELQWDFTYLQQVWEAIQTAANNKKAPFFIYQESDLFIRALRDYLQPDIGEILIDDRESYEKAREFMQQVMPHNLKKLSHYNDTTPLFSRYQIERQIQSAFEREVKLPSGGSIVIDHTEALLSIDINSARATKGADVETTALNTNLEAADEIARQLRIRDLGGLVVIDFIDMRNHKNQREVENRMRAAADIDRARVQVGKISKFGLLEMSRQRLRSSINDSSQITCPTCSGHGFIRSMDSLVISVIRLTEEEMIKPKTGKVVIQAPMDITNKILNEKRTELNEMEARHNVQVAVISNENLNFPDFHVQRYNTNESHINVADIKLVTPEDCHKAAQLDPPAPTKEKAMLQMVKPNAQAPKRSLGLKISSWFKSLFSSNKKKTRTNKKRQNKKPYNKKQGNNKQGKPQHKGSHKNQAQNKGKPQQHKQQGNKKPQHNKQQQQNKQTANKPQQVNKKPQHNKGHGQQQNAKAKQQGQPKQANQAQTKGNQQTDNKAANSKPQNNKQHSNKKPRGKSIYGNKNRSSKGKQNPTENTATEQTVDNSPTANKMTRPLGSVAELAAKKEAQVPSGAKSQAKPTQDKPAQNKQNQPKKADNKAAEATVEGKATDDYKGQSKPATQKAKQTDKTPSQNKAQVTDKAKASAATSSLQADKPKSTNANNKADTQQPVKTPSDKSSTPQSQKTDVKSKSTEPKDSNLQTESTAPKIKKTEIKAVSTGRPGTYKLTKTVDEGKTTKPASAKASQTEKAPSDDKMTKKTTKKKTSKKKTTKKTANKSAAEKSQASDKVNVDQTAKNASSESTAAPTAKKKTSKKKATKKPTAKPSDADKKPQKSAKPAVEKQPAAKADKPPKADNPTSKPNNDKQPDLFSEAPQAKPPKAEWLLIDWLKKPAYVGFFVSGKMSQENQSSTGNNPNTGLKQQKG